MWTENKIGALFTVGVLLVVVALSMVYWPLAVAASGLVCMLSAVLVYMDQRGKPE